MEGWLEAVLLMCVAVLALSVMSVTGNLMKLTREFQPVESQMSTLNGDVKSIIRELRVHFGEYFLNPRRVKERVTFTRDVCMVAEDHPIVPRVERLPEMGQVNIGGEQWLWCTSKSAKSAMSDMYGLSMD